jgi:hypothetical protein
MTTGIPNTLLRGGFDITPALKNFIINGDFRKWQRNTSFTDPNNVYTADRWKADMVATTGAGTVSRQAFTAGQTAVPGEPEYYLRYALTTALGASASILKQPIEDVRTLAGQKATISFSADMAASETKSFVVRLVQNFGSGGSASVASDSFTVNVTDTWQSFSGTVTVPSISGKTIGTDHYLELQIRDESTGDTYTVSFANIQVEQGEHATGFERVPDWVLDAQCYRYYLDASANSNFNLKYYGASGAGVANMRSTPVSFPVPMRKTPTMTIENEANVNVTASSLELDQFINERHFTPQWDESVGTSNITVKFGYTADAEL